jgi:hypothetical protein
MLDNRSHIEQQIIKGKGGEMALPVHDSMINWETNNDTKPKMLVKITDCRTSLLNFPQIMGDLPLTFETDAIPHNGIAKRDKNCRGTA